MGSSSVEKIKERLRIDEVIGSYLKLERAGINLKTKCPFHHEKTPSFFVSPERGSFYCFGCGEKGDIFTFVEKFENVDFVGALKILADKAGIELEKFSQKSEPNDLKTRLFSILESATEYYEKNIPKEKFAEEYLKNRGLKEETIKKWRVGYAKDEWREILEHLKNKGFSEDDIEKAGMIKRDSGKVYDRFRGRIMFPIFDSANRVVGFSGRTLSDSKDIAKYLNSPETPLFEKSKILYGYNFAKQAIRKFDYSVLVEGQVDIILAHQAGFQNTVASSGTALTEEHLSLLKRISNKIIMSFDSDNAGAKAAERAWALALGSGMEVKIAEMPDDYDPADIILEDKEKFKDALKNSIHLVDFLINRLLKETNDEKKLWSKIRQKVLPYISLIDSSAERAKYVSRIAELIKVKEEFVWDDLKKVKIEEELITKTEEDKVAERITENILKVGTALRSLASIVLNEKYFDQSEDIQKLKQEIESIIGQESFEKFKKALEEEKETLIFEAESYYGESPGEKIAKEIKILVLTLKEENYKDELAKLLFELKNEEKKGNVENAKKILEKANEITKKLSELKKSKI